MSLALPQLYDSEPTEYKNKLPHVLPQFFMPRLQDRPQDPIMDTLRIKQESNGREPRLRLPAESVKKTVKLKLPEEGSDVFWERTAKEGARVQVRSPPDEERLFLDVAFRAKSGLGIRCDPPSHLLLLRAHFYPSNRTARLQQLATGMTWQIYLCVSLI